MVLDTNPARETQQALNAFTRKYLKGTTPLIVDGKMGTGTAKRIKLVKYLLGYDHPTTTFVDRKFKIRMRHPKDPRFSSPKRIAAGVKRRIALRADLAKNRRKARASFDVATFDGVPVAAWFLPYLQWARNNGWQGRLVSGYRTPAYSESLCWVMCGAPLCFGKCAGRASNHSYKVKPGGAIDVSDHERFGRIVADAPFKPRLINRLPNDRVHFSASGQ